MNRGIVITTSEYTKNFLFGCVESCWQPDYPILIISNGGYKPDFDKSFDIIVNSRNGWELAGIATGKEKFDEFIHIMDTALVKDKTLFDKLFAIEGNVVLTKGNFHYMGKFVSKLLPEIPIISTKEEGIQLEQSWLPLPYTEFTPDLPVHTNVFEMIRGKKRMRLENDYLIKWKGTWRI